jgi:hypothetical protein
MRTSNFALRLQPTLLEAARNLAESEGVALNQLINVAVAQMVAAHSASNYIAIRAKRANLPRSLEILRKAGAGNPPIEGDELPESRLALSEDLSRIQGPKCYEVVREFQAFKEVEEGCALDEVPMRPGYLLQTFPEIDWRGRVWNGFETVKFRHSSSSPLRAHLEDFENCTKPTQPA